jgi:hypothetical protein
MSQFFITLALLLFIIDTFLPNLPKDRELYRYLSIIMFILFAIYFK